VVAAESSSLLNKIETGIEIMAEEVIEDVKSAFIKPTDNT
jgi:hypothetical protein